MTRITFMADKETEEIINKIGDAFKTSSRSHTIRQIIREYKNNRNSYHDYYKNS